MAGAQLTHLAVAERMRISPPTAAMHVRNARKKPGAASRKQAVVLALKRGLIDP